MENKLYEKIAQKKRCLGVLFELGGNLAAQCIAISGMDFYMINTEHGVYDVEGAMTASTATSRYGLTSLARAKDSSRSSVMKLLDAGADGVIVPCVETVEEVKNWFSTPNTTHWEIEALRPQLQVNSAMNSPMILRNNSGYPTNRRCFYRSARQPSAWSILRRLQL